MFIISWYNSIGEDFMLSIENTTNTIIVKKSKFITNTFRVFSENEALNIIDTIKEKYKDATHNCYAYKINNVKRYSDDGEPSGTAGIPILNVLEKNNLNYSLVIVTRYFGGIKLGSNGLIRAYSKATKDSLIIKKLTKGKNIDITFDYKDEKYINSVIKKENIIESSYLERIKYNCNISNNDIDKLNNYEYVINEEIFY